MIKNIFLLLILMNSNQALALDCSDARVRKVIVTTDTPIFHAQKACATLPQAIFVVEVGFNIKSQIVSKIDCGGINYTIYSSANGYNTENTYYMVETNWLLCL